MKDANKGGEFLMVEGATLNEGTVALKDAQPATIAQYFGWDELPDVDVESNVIVVNRPEEETIVLVLQ